MLTFDPLVHATKVIAKIDDLDELKKKTSIDSIEDLSFLKFEDLKTALPNTPVFKLRILELTIQYVAAGHVLDFTSTRSSIRKALTDSACPEIVAAPALATHISTTESTMAESETKPRLDCDNDSDITMPENCGANFMQHIIRWQHRIVPKTTKTSYLILLVLLSANMLLSTSILRQISVVLRSTTMDNTAVGRIGTLKGDYPAGMYSTGDDSQCHSTITVDVGSNDAHVDVDYDQDEDYVTDDDSDDEDDYDYDDYDYDDYDDDYYYHDEYYD